MDTEELEALVERAETAVAELSNLLRRLQEEWPGQDSVNQLTVALERWPGTDAVNRLDAATRRQQS